MENDEISFNFHKLCIEENKNKDKAFLCKKHFMTKDFNFDEFEDGLNVSVIDNNEENHKITKTSKNNDNNMSIDDDFSQDLDNFNENESQLIEKKLSFESIQIDFNNNNNNCNNNENNNDKNNYKKRITKEELNNTPLPIFDCIYCTNEKIVFNNFINNILSNKYLLLTSKYDINNINKLILNQHLIDKDENNEKLLNIIIHNTEYIKEYISKERNFIFFSSIIFNNLCEKYNSQNVDNFNRKLKIILKKKYSHPQNKNKISKILNNNKYLFNSSNTLINNLYFLNTFVEPLPHDFGNNNTKNNFIIGSGFNNSININSLFLNQNEYANYYNNKNNNDELEYSFEKIEKKDDSANYIEENDEIIDFFKYDLVRKISKKDIIWENKNYDIYNPEISSDFDFEDDYENDNCELINNNNLNLKNENYINNSDVIVKNSSEFDKYTLKNKNNTISVNNNRNNYIIKNINISNINNNNTNNNTFYNINLIEDINVNKSQGLYNIININNSSNQKLTTSYFQNFSSLEINKNYKIYNSPSFFRNKND